MTRGEEVYRALQRHARESGRGTQELLEFYVHEAFLDRLSRSPYADRLALKGGLLLATFGARRQTRDADLLIRGVAGNPEAITSVVTQILEVQVDDGARFDMTAIAVAPIRDLATYGGWRVAVPAFVSTAKLRLRLDLSVGDPIEPELTNCVRVLPGLPPIPVLAYPITGVLAEKIATMIELGDANTRDRDWADVYLLSCLHTVQASTLRATLLATTTHRGVLLRPLAEVVTTLPISRQATYAAFRSRAAPHLPDAFAEITRRVMVFAEPIIRGDASGTWDPSRAEWV